MSGNKIDYIKHTADVCVIGGGMTGICAALSAARKGCKTVLIHERPVLGGNASSECRMHICGADRHNSLKHMRETGILEEIRLENLYRNHTRNYSIWDTVLFEKTAFQNNLKVILNCSCFDAKTKNNTIECVKGWQMTTQTNHQVYAKIFIDCSGDSILAPLTGALFRVGREARNEFNESIAPETTDQKTMGMTCMFMAREFDSPKQFVPYEWAYKYHSCDELPYGAKGHRNWWQSGYWWIETGGEYDSVKDTEELRDELLKILFGVWDHIKNHCPYTKKKAENFELDWIQFLPAKRESRRYIGEHILTQNDIESAGHFDDIVAYGGWPMDDHHPAGFNARKINKPATIFHPAPSPYGIPYRCLYSKNIKNLMFAGRNISCTHTAMSSTRVMGTCSALGQAVGTSAAISVRKNVFPAQLLDSIDELQQELLYDDCYIPWKILRIPDFIINATLTASNNKNPEPVRDGIQRQVGNNSHCWFASEGDWISYEFPAPCHIRETTVILDSAMDKLITLSVLQRDDQLTDIPDVTPKELSIVIKQGGRWKLFKKENNNYQRMYRITLNTKVEGIKLIIDKLRGAPETRVYGFYAI